MMSLTELKRGCFGGMTGSPDGKGGCVCDTGCKEAWMMRIVIFGIPALILYGLFKRK